MERRPEISLPAPTLKSSRTKEKPAPPPRDRKHKVSKTVKIQEPDRGEDKDDIEDRKDEPCTVINVDSVRQRTNKECESLLGLQESEWPEEG